MFIKKHSIVKILSILSILEQHSWTPETTIINWSETRKTANTLRVAMMNIHYLYIVPCICNTGFVTSLFNEWKNVHWRNQGIIISRSWPTWSNNLLVNGFRSQVLFKRHTQRSVVTELMVILKWLHANRSSDGHVQCSHSIEHCFTLSHDAECFFSTCVAMKSVICPASDWTEQLEMSVCIIWLYISATQRQHYLLMACDLRPVPF